jgi:hypothetical protein
MGRVAGPRTEIQEERLFGIDRTEIGDELDGPVDEVLREVVSLVVAPGRCNLMVVVHQRRRELVRLAAEEAVETLETPPERPVGTGCGEVLLFFRREVPLADGERGVTLLEQHLGEETVLPGDVAVVAREPERKLDDTTHGV